MLRSIPAVRLLAGVVLVGSLASCGEKNDPEQDAADVAEVREMHDTPPIVPIAPQRISYTDIEDNGLFGAGCGFTPGKGTGIVLLAQNKHAFMKLDGEIVDFAPDVGGTSLPMNAWASYSGRRYTIELAKPRGGGDAEDVESTRWLGASITVRDTLDRPVFRAQGTLQCGA